MLRPDADAAVAVLEGFVSDNPELEELEALIAPLNLFEAVGLTHQEIRHSHFLAFLLDPSAAHGLGDYIARRLLTTAVRRVPAAKRQLSAVDLDVIGAEDIEVRREWRNIDILLTSRALDVAVVIENKVWSGEHDDQLERYYATVLKAGLASRFLGIYLTPAGHSPNHEEYVAVSYADIVGILDGVLARRMVSADLDLLVRHYTQLIWRHVLEDSDVARLAQAIYRKHRAALDILFEHRPFIHDELLEHVVELVRDEPALALDTSEKRWVRFAPHAWDECLPRTGEGWVASGRMLCMEFAAEARELVLKAVIGPGPEPVRQALFEWAASHAAAFDIGRNRRLTPFKVIWKRQMLTPDDLDLEPAATLEILRARWREFIELDLPALSAAAADFRRVDIGG